MTVDYKIFDRDKFTVVGNPTITDDGVANGFSSSNYLTGGSFSFGSLPWEIRAKVKYISSSQTDQDICNASSASVANFRFFIKNSKLSFIVGSGGSFWESSEQYGTTTLTTNTDYFVKFNYTGSSYNIYLSSDGVNYNLEKSFKSNTPIGNISTLFIGINRTLNNDFKFIGSIDLKQFSITVDGKEVFSGSRNGTLTDKLIYLNDTKELIRQAIISKGVDIPAGTPFREYADKINLILVAPQEGIRTKDGVLYIPKGTVFDIINFETQETTQYILPEEISIPNAAYGSVTMSDGQEIRYGSTVSSYQTTNQATGIRFRQNNNYMEEEPFNISSGSITLEDAIYSSTYTFSGLRRLKMLNFTFTTNKGLGINKLNVWFRNMSISSVNGVYIHDWGTTKPSEFEYSGGGTNQSEYNVSNKISGDDPSISYLLISNKSGITISSADCNLQEGHYYTLYSILTCSNPTTMQIKEFTLGYEEMVYYYDQDLYIQASGDEESGQKDVSIRISPYGGGAIGTVKYNPETNWYDGKPIE